jgi:hypothetical protein
MGPEAEKANHDRPRFFDPDKGLLQRRVFIDPVLYRQELSGIFRHSWLFVGPENWLRLPGDFVTSRMGEDAVVVWRGDDGVLRAFVNLCLSGHQPVCSESRGRALHMSCPCHQWVHDSRGRRLDHPGRHLPEIPCVAGYKGLVFANHDAGAEPLLDWLGEFAWYLDLMVDRKSGGVEAYGGDAFRWTIEANWKVPVDAFCGDIYRNLTANAATETVIGALTLAQEDGFQVFAANGAIAISTASAERPQNAEEPLGQPRCGFQPLIGTLFPTLSFDGRTPSLHVWHPVGPSRTEIHSYCLVDTASTTQEKEAARRAFQFQYGPAGLRSEDDIPLWKSITARARGRRDLPLNLQMGLGHERRTNLPGHVNDLISEGNQRQFFAWWQQRLGAPDAAPPRWIEV